MVATKITRKIITQTLRCFLFVFVFLSATLITPANVQAQTNPINEINLQIPSVTKDGKKINTTKNGDTKWTLDASTKLNLDDGIRYSWTGVDIDLKYKDLPSQFGGYLKIYKDNDSKEENFILDFGTYPADSVGLKLSNLKSQLREGENTLMFVFIGYNNLTPTAKSRVTFTFQFQNTSGESAIDIIKPKTGAVFAENIHQTFEIDLTNFILDNTDSSETGRGKMNFYFNEVSQSTLLGTISTSLEQSGKQKVIFNSKDFENFNKIPDNFKTQIIFVLTKSNGELLGYRQSVEVVSNFKNSLDVGLPRISIVEPNRDRANMQVSGSQKFILKIDNFELTNRQKAVSENQKDKGYLQIILNNRVVEIASDKTEFTLNEIGASQFGEGTLNVKVQLVNYDFTKLNPEATDFIEIFFIPQDANQTTEIQQVENNTWRFVIMGLIIILVIGSVSVLITKG